MNMSRDASIVHSRSCGKKQLGVGLSLHSWKWGHCRCHWHCCCQHWLVIVTVVWVSLSPLSLALMVVGSSLSWQLKLHQIHQPNEDEKVDLPNAHEVWVTHPRNPELEKIHLAHGSTSWLYKT